MKALVGAMREPCNDFVLRLTSLEMIGEKGTENVGMRCAFCLKCSKCLL